MSWTFKGFKINVADDGKFVARMGGSDGQPIELIADTLPAVRLKIDASLKTGLKLRKLELPVIGVMYKGKYHNVSADIIDISDAVLTGFNRNDRSLRVSYEPHPQHKQSSIDDEVYADTPENRALLKEWIDVSKRKEQLDELIHSIQIGAPEGHGLGYGRVEPGDYEAGLRIIEQAYAKSKKGVRRKDKKKQ